MNKSGDTQPVRPIATTYANEVAPPPPLLKFVVWGMVFIVILTLIGGILGAYAFRNWVPPRYQVTYSERFPVLALLLPPPTAPDTVLPTPVPQENVGGLSPEDLLGMPLDDETEEATEVSTEAANEEAATEPEVVALAPTETLQPTATATLVPTAVPTATISPELVSVLNSPTHPPSARLFGMEAIRQTWNNCGPANVTMALSYYGWREDQTYAQNFLRGNREDKNVSPNELVRFVNEQSGVRALYRIGGDLDLLKRLLAAEFPVIIETGYMPEGNDWLGHYQTVVGYDDATQSLYVFDSYLGAGPDGTGLPETYNDVDRSWQHFNRTFIVLYREDREGELASILGDHATVEGAAQHALDVAQEEARANPQNGFAWFNIGTANVYLGNYEAAASAFDQARLRNLPWRMTWYQFGPFEAYYETQRYSDVLALVDANEASLGGGFVEETHYWEGRALVAQGDERGAEAAFRSALQQNSRFQPARDALDQL